MAVMRLMPTVHTPKRNTPILKREHSHEVPSLKDRIFALDKVTGTMAFMIGLLAVFLMTRDVTHSHHDVHHHDGHQHGDHQHADHDHDH